MRAATWASLELMLLLWWLLLLVKVVVDSANARQGVVVSTRRMMLPVVVGVGDVMIIWTNQMIADCREEKEDL
jgi:hypothetical protein